jgi:uncharacterized membrane protein YdcZ (DUF606 family)
MARYDEIAESNWLTRKEKLIQKSVNFFLGIMVLDFLLIIIKPKKRLHLMTQVKLLWIYWQNRLETGQIIIVYQNINTRL